MINCLVNCTVIAGKVRVSEERDGKNYQSDRNEMRRMIAQVDGRGRNKVGAIFKERTSFCLEQGENCYGEK